MRLARLPQMVPICANLVMSAVVNKLGKQRTKP